jgi:predicted phosphodiesterase
LVDLFRFSHRLHRQIPAITDAKDASLRAKQKEKIREIVQKGDFLENFNTLRVAMGQRQLTAMQAYLQLVAFNNLATTSTLRDTKSRTFLHFLWKRFRHWRDPSVEGSIQRAEAFVLRHFPTDVFVAGHTHLPHHRQTQSPSGRQKHSLNPGSWSELPRSAKPKKSTGLHYVELRMNDGRATPALSRWRTPVRAAKHKPISSK